MPIWYVKTFSPLATDTSVHVYDTHGQHDPPSVLFRPVTSFFLGCRIISAAWSPSTRCIRDSDDADSWQIEILVATDVDELRLLTASSDEDVPTSHKKVADLHARVLDVAWCGSSGYESFVATACADGAVQVWNLEPENGSDSATCQTHYLDSAVLSVAFHTKMPKLLLAFESGGVGYCIDWLASREELRTTASFHEPMTVGLHATQGYDAQGAAAWQSQDADIVGALLGTRWSVWNMSTGHVPVASGQLHQTSATGYGGFRFCPTNSRLFAVFVSTLSHHVLTHSGYSTSTSGLAGSTAAVYIFDSAVPSSPRAVDVHRQTPLRGGSVLLDATGHDDSATLPTAYGVQSIDWLPRRVGPYDVLLVGVGHHVVPIPAA